MNKKGENNIIMLILMFLILIIVIFMAGISLYFFLNLRNPVLASPSDEVCTEKAINCYNSCNKSSACEQECQKDYELCLGK